jgi:hypothetical protein
MKPGFLIFSLILSLAACASAEDRMGGPWDRAALKVGAELLGEFDTTLTIQSQSSGIPAIPVNLERDLGFSSETGSARVDLFYRIDRRNRLDLSAFSIKRDASVITARPLTIGDITIPAGSGVSADFNTLVGKFAYRHIFFPRDDWEIGASLGLHMMLVDTTFAAFGVGGLQEKFTAPVPAPVIGLHGAYAISDDWLLQLSTELFALSLNAGRVDMDGLLSDTLFSVEYNFWDYSGVGQGYNFFLMDASVGDFNLKFNGEYSYHGLLLYLKLRI